MNVASNLLPPFVVWAGALFLLSLTALAKTWTISIEGVQFRPAQLEVKKGDLVVWQNKDIVVHTVTSATEGYRVESGSIETGKNFTKKMTRSGEFNYFCRFHPTMKGVVQVKP